MPTDENHAIRFAITSRQGEEGMWDNTDHESHNLSTCDLQRATEFAHCWGQQSVLSMDIEFRTSAAVLKFLEFWSVFGEEMLRVQVEADNKK